MHKKGRRNQGQDRMMDHPRPLSLCSRMLACKLLHQQHELTYMVKTALETLLGWHYLIAHILAFCSVSQ